MFGCKIFFSLSARSISLSLKKKSEKEKEGARATISLEKLALPPPHWGGLHKLPFFTKKNFQKSD